MRLAIACMALLLAGCGAAAEPSEAAAAGPKLPLATREVYEVRTESKPAPAGFEMKEPSASEQAAEIAKLQTEFEQYAEQQPVRATYRYLSSGDLAIVERAAYIGASPAYAHYLAVKAGKFLSIVCVAHEPVPGAVVSASNCADTVGQKMGANYQALITGSANND